MMVEATHTPEEILKTLDRVVKGAETLCRKGALRNDRVDDPLETMALHRPEVHRFEWVFEEPQRRQLQELRNSFRDIEDWTSDALEASKQAVAKERHRRLSSRCRDALGDLWGFLEFGSFKISGKPDKELVREALSNGLQKLKGISDELRDCIERAGKLPRAEPAPGPARPGPTVREDAQKDTETRPTVEADASTAEPAPKIPNPAEHTLAQMWTKKDGSLWFGTKTKGEPDGKIRLRGLYGKAMQICAFRRKEGKAATLGEIAEELYGPKMRAGPGAREMCFTRVRSHITYIRRKFREAGMPEDILPRIGQTASGSASVPLRVKSFIYHDYRELDEADEPPD